MSHESKKQNKQAITRLRPTTIPLPIDQIIGGVVDRLKKWLPGDNKTFFFELVALVCLVIAVINFAEKEIPNF